jgi:tol-pal system protein YbgF
VTCGSRSRLTAGVAVLALAGGGIARAGENAVQVKLNDLDERLTHIERVLSNQSLLELANQSEALRSDLRAMHNDVDQLTNSLEARRKQQRDLYADLDRRLKRLESRGVAAAAAAGGTGAVIGGAGVGGAGAGGSAAGAGDGSQVAAADAGSPAVPAAGDSAPPAPPEDKVAYQAAFGLLKEGQYDRSIGAFQKFLSAYPESQFTDNAQYWLGEAYYVNKSFPDAQAAFQRVVDKYPQSRKLPDALLKIGYCEYELKQWDSAQETLLQVVTKYSDTPAGHLAQQRLDKMAAEQH